MQSITELLQPSRTQKFKEYTTMWEKIALISVLNNQNLHILWMTLGSRLFGRGELLPISCLPSLLTILYVSIIPLSFFKCLKHSDLTYSIFPSMQQKDWPFDLPSPCQPHQALIYTNPKLIPNSSSYIVLYSGQITNQPAGCCDVGENLSSWKNTRGYKYRI